MAISLAIINETAARAKIFKIMRNRIDQNNYNKIILAVRILTNKKKYLKNV